MVDARDHHGVCRATLDEVAKAAALSLTQVRHAVERQLAPIGLVVTLDRDVRPDQRSHRSERRVVGHDAGSGSVRVPRSVYERAIANFEAAARPSPRPSLLADRTPHRCQAPVGIGIRCAGSVVGGSRPTETPTLDPTACDDRGLPEAADRRAPGIGGAPEATEHDECESAMQARPLTMTANGCHLDHDVAEGEGQKPEHKRGKPSAPIAAGADPKVQCVAALQIDGATSFMANVGEAMWHPDVQDALRAARRGGLVRLHDSRGRAFALPVQSATPGRIELKVEGRVTIKIDRYRETVEVIAAKEEVWTYGGIGPWANTWLRLASHWFLGQRCTGLTDAGSAGWRVHRLELASDFTGFPFLILDEANFRSRLMAGALRSSLPKNGERETIEAGRRGRGQITISVHDKHAEIRKKQKVEPIDSIYAPLWKAHGWRGRLRVRRVEVRADGKALKLQDARTGQVFDLSEPSALLDRDMLARLWHEGTHRHLFALPAEGVGKGKKPGTWIGPRSRPHLRRSGRWRLRPARPSACSWSEVRASFSPQRTANRPETWTRSSSRQPRQRL
ncbi:MAG: hypothetical protein ACE37F_00700 [Nannocystaceae bacterium]|nr:hypothetical protein [bacterium]